MDARSNTGNINLAGYLDDRVDAGVVRVDRSVFTDPEIFELEMERIWEGNWIYLAHESQIPKPNDFMTLFMGRQPVILVRSPEGEVNAFINACGHRGTTLVRWPQRRDEVVVHLGGHPIRVKLAPGRAKVEHDDAAAAAKALGLSLREVLAEAAQLARRAAAIRAQIGAPIWLAFRAAHERAVALLREALGERAFAQAWAEGADR